jgi:formylglycine-generating enzyme required for sulfatase activity
MHGQVWEWCADPWHGNYRNAPQDSRVWDEQNKNNNHYQKIVDNLAELLKDDRPRFRRGGSWHCDPWICRSACRYGDDPDNTSDNNGFRVACGGARTQ